MRLGVRQGWARRAPTRRVRRAGARRRDAGTSRAAGRPGGLRVQAGGRDRARARGRRPEDAQHERAEDRRERRMVLATSPRSPSWTQSCRRPSPPRSAGAWVTLLADWVVDTRRTIRRNKAVWVEARYGRATSPRTWRVACRFLRIERERRCCRRTTSARCTARTSAARTRSSRTQRAPRLNLEFEGFLTGGSRLTKGAANPLLRRLHAVVRMRHSSPEPEAKSRSLSLPQASPASSARRTTPAGLAARAAALRRQSGRPSPS